MTTAGATNPTNISRGLESENPRAPFSPDVLVERRDRMLRASRLAAHLVLVSAVLVAVMALVKSSAFDVDEIDIYGLSSLDAEAIQEAGGIHPGDSLIGIDTGQAGRGIESLSWVEDAQVRRSWNGTVTVDVRERQPLLRVVTEDGVALVDRSGTVITTDPETTRRYAALPAVSGLSVGEAGTTVKPDGLAAFVTRILSDRDLADLGPGAMLSDVVVSGQDLRARLNNGPTVELGSVNLHSGEWGIARGEMVARDLKAVLEEVPQTDIASIDLGVPGAPSVALRIDN
ncbi:MAG: FtsQ-type POTRA domain-containing protein [Actinobacteria bacterium]|nr:FtsQ-type POTRA domain-containing protein [Actinomycetota bacterium]MCB9388946.1 FtsQ-type POTRA domain-containing protein [Acidimicrobiia bacterium]